MISVKEAEKRKNIRWEREVRGKEGQAKSKEGEARVSGAAP